MKKNLNDIVYTPRSIAKKIYNYFSPIGSILEPCMGKGAFYDLFPKNNRDWCEIQKGRDFMIYTRKVDWIMTNPPFSEYEKFFKKSIEIADNIVFLIPLVKVFRNMGELETIKKYGGIKTILVIGGGGTCNFNFGFIVGCVYLKKGYKGLCKIDFLDINQEEKLF